MGISAAERRRVSPVWLAVGLALIVAMSACSGAQTTERPVAPRDRVRQAMKAGNLGNAESEARGLARGGALDDQLLLAEVLLLRGRHAEAADRLAPLAQQHPMHPGVAGLYARALDALGRRAKAVTAYARRLRLAPDDAIAALRMGSLLLAQDDALHASQVAAAGIKLHPRDAELRLLNARALLRRGRLARALKAANAGLQIDPEQVSGWLVLARIQIGLGEQARAETSLKRGLTYDAQRVDALRLLASLRAARGAHDLAVITLRRALAVQPDSPSLLNAIATQRHRLGQTKQAIVALRRAAKIAPKQLVLHRNLAELLLEVGEIAEAARIARGAAGFARRADPMDARLRAAIDETLSRVVCAEVMLIHICRGGRDAAELANALRTAFTHEGVTLDQAHMEATAAEVAVHVKRAAARCKRPGATP